MTRRPWPASRTSGRLRTRSRPGQAGLGRDPGQLVRADLGPGEPVARLHGRSRSGVPQPDPFASQLPAGRLHLDQRPAGRREQLGHPAQQRRRVAPDADVPVREQHDRPAAGPRHPAEHVPQQRQRARRPGDTDGVRGDVDAERGHAALGQRHRQPPGSRPHVKRRPAAPVDERGVPRPQPPPVVGPQRRDAPVRVLDLGLRTSARPPGERLAVQCADHTEFPQRRESQSSTQPVFTAPVDPAGRTAASSPFRHRPYGLVTISCCSLTAAWPAELPCISSTRQVSPGPPIGWRHDWQPA